MKKKYNKICRALAFLLTVFYAANMPAQSTVMTEAEKQKKSQS
jgi:hypothetical protein